MDTDYTEPRDENLPDYNKMPLTPEIQYTKDFLRESIDIESFCTDIMNVLGAREKNIEENEDGEKVIVYKPIPNMKPRLSDLGLRMIISMVKAFVSKHTALSNFDKKEADGIIFDFKNDLNKILMLRSQDYSAENADFLWEADFEEINIMVDGMVIPLVRRAIDGKERQTIREPKVYQSTEHRTINEEPKKKFLGFI